MNTQDYLITKHQIGVGEWLERLEKGPERMQLWPNTPTGNIQAEIWRRCGASDWNMGDVRCRARIIVDTLQELVTNDLLVRRFTVLDLCCGDGVVLLQIGRAFLGAEVYGIDLLDYPTHRVAETRGGASFYRVPLQRLAEEQPPQIIDVALMLNTFRGWDRAGLPAEDHDLPERTQAWLRAHCRYVFLTVESPEIKWLKEEGWFVWVVGPGEDASKLVCAFPCKGPEGMVGQV